MEVKSDPAGRLCDLLQEARRKNETTKVRTVWAAVFKVEESDSGAILRMLSDMIQVSYKTQDRIRELENIDHELFLKPFENIEKLFSQINLEGSWQTGKRLLDEPTIYGLQFCSDRLSREASVSTVNHEEIERIQKILSELTETVLSLDFEPNLKSLLIRNLEGLRQAIIAYRIRGIEGIEAELEASFGSLALKRDMVKSAVEKDPAKKGFFSKYMPFLEGINKTVTTAKNIDNASGNSISKILGLESS